MKNISLVAVFLLLAGAAWAAESAPVLLTVNGTPIKREEALRRLWSQYGDAVVGQMVDETVIAQAAQAMKIKPDEGQIAVRLKRIQSQFPDETTFKQKLASTGGSVEGLKAQLTAQVLREQLVTAARHLAVTDAEVKGFFDANKEKLGVTEGVHLRNILVATEKEASDFLVALRAGADFAGLASQASLDKGTKERGGDLGWVGRGMLQPGIEQVVFALKPGQVSDPVQTSQGHVLFKAEEIRHAKPAVFKDIQKDLKQALLAEKISKAWPDYLQELRQKAKVERPAQP